MIHYTCDRCKCLLDPEDLRYVVKVEAYASMNPQEDVEVEGDRDHLLELHEIFERSEDADDELISDEIYSSRRFDLCPECHRKFLASPLGRERQTVDFSQN